MYQNAGEKGTLHPDPEDPPRRRANKKKGHGTYDNDRPPVAGLVGRESGQIRLRVIGNSTRAILEPFVLRQTLPGTNAYTDEWGAYNHLAANDRQHATVNHGAHEWARDDDGDGINEVHCNTMEGIWTGLRNYLRIFRGVRKDRLHLYVAMFQWSYNLKTATDNFLRTLLGVPTTQGT